MDRFCFVVSVTVFLVSRMAPFTLAGVTPLRSLGGRGPAGSALTLFQCPEKPTDFSSLAFQGTGDTTHGPLQISIG